MNAIQVLRKLGPVDLKNIRRDSLLAWVMLAPLLLALVLRVAVPELIPFVQSRADFDLTPYLPLLASFFVLLAPIMAGFVVGFLLLDERDEHVLTAMMVTPMPVSSYLVYRILLPMGAGTVITALTYPLLGFAPLAPLDLVVAAALSAFNAPLMALFLAAFAENKVAGLAMMKIANAAMMIPVAGYFLPVGWGWLVGVVPSYWGMKVLWLAAAGAPYAIYALVGVVVNAGVIYLLLRRFVAVMHRAN